MLPPAPAEPPRDNNPDHLAPWFRGMIYNVVAAANQLLDAHGYDNLQFDMFEGLRSNERQEWLYGSGRTYRGAWCTNAATNAKSWHGFGLAADIVPRPVIISSQWGGGKTLGDFTWDCDAGVWALLNQAALANGCITGIHWHSVDEPHVQPACVPVTPTDEMRSVRDTKSLADVWDLTRPAAMLAAA